MFIARNGVLSILRVKNSVLMVEMLRYYNRKEW